MTIRTFNIYCDESCHLQNDGENVMVLGAISCPADHAAKVSREMRRIKESHDVDRHLEIKWTKVSRGKAALYLDIVRYFFSDSDISFRALVVKHKEALCHDAYDQTHDDWYYKMYFSMLKTIFRPRNCRYRIYLDMKDTKGSSKIRKLHDVLCNNIYDFRKDIIERVQLVRSHEVAQVQLADLLIGCIAYANRGLASSDAKNHVVKLVKEQSGYMLTRSTLLAEQKLNLFCWEPKEIDIER